MPSPTIPLLLVCATCCTGQAWAADEMSVQVKSTVVRDRDSYLGKPVYELRFGDRVSVLQKGAAWLKVQPVNPAAISLPAGTPLAGFVNKSALTTKRVVLQSDPNAPVSASSEDVALAGKGFNEDVERTYQSQHPNLSAAYSSLNQIELNSAYMPTPEEISEFRAQGGLAGGVS